MPRPILLPGLDDVDWASRRGAYGPSVGDHDIAAALRVLATDFDGEGDDRQDAYDLVLWSHGWHQGSIYPVTATIVPFLVRLIDGGADVDDTLSSGLASFATSARREPHTDDAAGVIAALEDAADTILGWHGPCVAAVAAAAPRMCERWLAGLAAIPSTRPLDDSDYLALAALPAMPAWARARVAADACGNPAAAVALARCDPTSAAVAATLTPAGRASLEDLASLFGVDIPVPARGVLPVASLHSGPVVFVSAALVVVRIGTTNVTVRARSTGLARGAEVTVGLAVTGEPRLLVYRDADGREQRVEL